MKIRLECPGCNAAYQIERQRLSKGAIRFTCRKCAGRCKAEMSGDALTITPLTHPTRRSVQIADTPSGRR